jgi:hypothetical protein
MKKLTLTLLAIWITIFSSSVGMAHDLLLTGLHGSEEVPGPGDEDGFGHAIILLKPRFEKICFVLFVSNIEEATAAHIHEGEFGIAGPVVVGLETPSDGIAVGCIEDVPEDLINDIADNPEQYYVNVHNEEFPSGALRGQLGRSHRDDDGGGDGDDDSDDDDDDDNDDDDDDDDDDGDDDDDDDGDDDDDEEDEDDVGLCQGK